MQREGIMTDREKAIDKIKKLLRMERGGTPDEIATAIKLAQELAAKHGIDLDSVNPDEEDAKPINHQDAEQATRIQSECTYSSLICQRFFNVSCFSRVIWYRHSEGKRINTWALTFVGTAWDIEIALYVYHFLVRQFRHAWNHKSGKSRNRTAFMDGFYDGVYDVLSRKMPREVTAENHSNAVVAISRALMRRNDYIAEYFGEMETSDMKVDHDADGAHRLGFLAGRETEIRSGVKGSKEETKLLT